MSSKRRPPRKKRPAKGSKLEALIAELEQLAKQALGGSAERPIEVTSAAVIEPRAHALPCPRCVAGGELKVEDHTSEDGLRAVKVRCQRCSTARTLWFRLVPEQLN